MASYFKLIRLLLLPLILFSLAIYLCLYLVSPVKLAFQISLLLGFLLTLFSYSVEKPNWRRLAFLLLDWKCVLLLMPALFLVMTYGFVLSPMVKTVVVDGQPVMGLNSLGDYYKHLYVLTAVRVSGLPPAHPFFPDAQLSYYYGYYLLPAAISSVFNLDLITVFFFFLLFTTALLLLVIVLLALAFFRPWYQRLLLVTLFLVGTGLDIFPTLIQAKAGILTANHIEFWSQILNQNNYLVNNLYTVLFWVPQHSLTSLIVFFTGILFFSKTPISFIWLVPATWFCIISSTFVSVSLVIWLGLAWLFNLQSRSRLVLAGLFATVLLMPYLFDLRGRGSLLSFGFYMTPFQYLSFLPSWVNYLLTFFTEFGLIILALPLFFHQNQKKNYFRTLVITLAISFPIILGLFVRSTGFNDYSMRSILPSQMALPFLMVFCLDKVTSKPWKKIIFLMLVFSLIPAATGLFYEIHFRLLDRSIIPASSSNLLFYLRQHKIPRLAVIDNADWVYLIPSYGNQTVTSPRLFDSTSYLTGEGFKQQSLYGQQVGQLFIDEISGSSIKNILEIKQQNFQKIKLFFYHYHNNNFLISKFHGTSLGLNPWYSLFTLVQTKNTTFTPLFSLYYGQDLYQSLLSTNILVHPEATQKIQLSQSKQFYLRFGFWIISGCSRSKMDRLKLDLVDSYLLFDLLPDPNRSACAGQLYFQQQPGNLSVSVASHFDTLFATPVQIKLTPPNRVFW